MTSSSVVSEKNEEIQCQKISAHAAIYKVEKGSGGRGQLSHSERECLKRNSVIACLCVCVCVNVRKK